MRLKKNVRRPGDAADAVTAEPTLGPSKALQELVPFLVMDLARCQTLQAKLDKAFGGQLFLPNEPPTSRKNRQRVDLYFRMHWAIIDLKIRLSDECMRLHGVDPNKPQQMWETAVMLAAIGTTAAPVRVPSQQAPGGQPITPGGPPETYSPEVVTLATYLTKHAHEKMGPPGVEPYHKGPSSTGRRVH